MRHRSERLINEINADGFVAIMLLLLFLILADSHWPSHDLRPVDDYPKAAHFAVFRGADDEHAVVISINQYGQVFLGRDVVTMDRLSIPLRDAIDRSEDKRVYVRADARAKYVSVLRVIEVLQSEKIGSVVFLVNERKKSVVP